METTPETIQIELDRCKRVGRSGNVVVNVFISAPRQIVIKRRARKYSESGTGSAGYDWLVPILIVSALTGSLVALF